MGELLKPDDDGRVVEFIYDENGNLIEETGMIVDTDGNLSQSNSSGSENSSDDNQ